MLILSSSQLMTYSNWLFTSVYLGYGKGGALQVLPIKNGAIINFGNMTILPE
jgi:hypothetical protein